MNAATWYGGMKCLNGYPVRLRDGRCAVAHCGPCWAVGLQPERLPERQARRDAEADAETLRLFMRDGRHLGGPLHPLGWMLGFMNLGASTRAAIARGQQNLAARRARHAFRAARNWIPGL